MVRRRDEIQTTSRVSFQNIFCCHWLLPSHLEARNERLVSQEGQLYLRLQCEDRKKFIVGKLSINDLKIWQMAICFKLDHFVKGKGLKKVIRILVRGKAVSPKDNVTAWIFFYNLRRCCLGTMGRQLGGRGKKRPDSWPLDDPGRRREMVLMQGILGGAFSRLPRCPRQCLMKVFRSRRPLWV